MTGHFSATVFHGPGKRRFETANGLRLPTKEITLEKAERIEDEPVAETPESRATRLGYARLDRISDRAELAASPAGLDLTGPGG